MNPTETEIILYRTADVVAVTEESSTTAADKEDIRELEELERRLTDE